MKRCPAVAVLNVGRRAPRQEQVRDGDVVVLDRDVERTASGLRSAFVVMGVTALVLIGCAVVGVLRTRFRA